MTGVRSMNGLAVILIVGGIPNESAMRKRLEFSYGRADLCQDLPAMGICVPEFLQDADPLADIL